MRYCRHCFQRSEQIRPDTFSTAGNIAVHDFLTFQIAHGCGDDAEPVACCDQPDHSLHLNSQLLEAQRIQFDAERPRDLLLQTGRALRGKADHGFIQNCFGRNWGLLAAEWVRTRKADAEGFVPQWNRDQ